MTPSNETADPHVSDGVEVTQADVTDADKAAVTRFHNIQIKRIMAGDTTLGEDGRQTIEQAFAERRLAGIAEGLRLTATPVWATAEGMRFRKLMGTKDQPADLEAYAEELESLIRGADHRADQWRWIANEMGYEPSAHAHAPLGTWLTDRIAKFRQQAALTTRPTDTAARDEGVMRESIRNEIVNTPETADFMAGVPLEAAHQRERWGSEHDAGKTPFDWFWLIGYLAQKAAAAHVAGDAEKALHHTISTAAALANWHAAISGACTAMRPGIEPPAALAVSPPAAMDGGEEA